jgi:cation diffusion facilitator family transporter
MSIQNTHTTNNAVLFGLLSNLVLVALKALVGIFGNSFALIADAIESATDSASSLMLWLGLRYAQRPPDENHPYGHGRFEALLTFLVVFFLMISAISIGIQAYVNLQEPQTLPEPFTLIALIGIVAYKEGSFRYIRSKARRIQSSILEAEAWHHRADAFSSAAALIGIGLAWMLGPDFAWLDEAAAFISAMALMINAYRIFRKAFSEFMDEDLYHPMAKEILEIGQELPFISGIPTCRIRKLGARYFVDLHVRVDPEISVAQGHAHAHALKDKIKTQMPLIEDVLIHVEPVETFPYEPPIPA